MLCYAMSRVGRSVSEKIRRDANQFVRKKDRVRNPSKQQANRSMVKKKGIILWLIACYVTHISYSVWNDIEISNRFVDILEN